MFFLFQFFFYVQAAACTHSTHAPPSKHTHTQHTVRITVHSLAHSHAATSSSIQQRSRISRAKRLFPKTSQSCDARVGLVQKLLPSLDDGPLSSLPFPGCLISPTVSTRPRQSHATQRNAVAVAVRGHGKKKKIEELKNQQVPTMRGPSL